MAEPAASGPEASDVVLVLTTAPSEEVATDLVRRLVEERLIACGNLLRGVTSIYRWQGAVAEEEEVLILMKAPRGLVARLFSRVTELHPYEVPELVTLAADAVSAAYSEWVRQETTKVNA